MTSKRTTREILQHAEETLFTARLGLDHLRGSDARARMAGLRNVVVFGRATTNVLQNLRSTESDFDAWYGPHVQAMRVDRLLKYFYDLRTQILKQGALAVSSSMTFSGNPMALMRQFKAPPRAKGFFIGDSIGGSGWEVETDDGSTEKYYVAIPDNSPGLKIDMNVHLADAPDEYKSMPAAEVCELYLSRLESLLVEAKECFRKSAT